MEILSTLAQQYAEIHSTPQDELLQEVESYTRAHHTEPHMISGFLQGRFLSLFSELVKPERILEIGTLTGFSALCLAKGLTSSGVLHTIEKREQDAAVAQSFFDRSLFSNQIKLHRGDAHAILPSLTETWDLVFLDADKTAYLDYFNMVFPFVRSGGYILADNVFFHGQVFTTELKGKNAKAIAQFNREIAQRQDVEVIMVPLRDGLSVIKKIK
ncbi:MAG: O-methyltransferase [Chitinophagia bacterium]|nr:O-methyltransferase [Chitinophagia bacterium]